MTPLRATDPPAVGEFTLLGRLGSGGMGEVYLGVTRSGRPVAVKVVRPDVAADPAFRARFVREVAAARRVGGFWTASVVAADPEAEAPWLATEYVPGPSLRQAVAEAGPLPAAAVRVVAARLAEALAAIHAAGLVHRDLKPANVLLAPGGPMVIDFGIARAFHPETAGQTAVIGTPSFMAPEQIRGEPLTPAADVFALGATLGYAVRGRGPFHAESPHGVLYRVVAGEPDLDGVPAELRDLVAGCLAKDPAARPTTGQLLAELAPATAAVVTPYGGWRPPPHDPVAELAPSTDGRDPGAPAPTPASTPTAPAAATAPAAPTVPPAATAEPPATGPVAAATAALPTRPVPPGEPAPPGPPPQPASPGASRRVSRCLAPAERHRGEWRPHPAYLAVPLTAAGGATLLLGLLAGFALAYLGAAWFATVPVVVWVGVLGGLAWRVGAWRLERLVLTDRRLMLVTGLVRPRVAAVPLAEVAQVRYRQSRLGRALGYGTLVVDPAGPRRPALREVPHLRDPAALCRRIATELAMVRAAATAAAPRLPGPSATRARKSPPEDRTSV